MAHGDQFGEDADGNLRRSDGADVEPDGRVHAREALGGHAFRRQRVYPIAAALSLRTELFNLRWREDPAVEDEDECVVAWAMP